MVSSLYAGNKNQQVRFHGQPQDNLPDVPHDPSGDMNQFPQECGDHVMCP